MKKVVLITLLLLPVMMIHSQETSVKSRKEIKAEQQAREALIVRTLINSMNFRFEAIRANTARGRSITAHTYYVDIKNDTVISYLPFFGVAYTASFGSSGSPLNFTQPIRDSSIKEDRKGYSLELEIRNGSDNLTYNFSISESGHTSLIVTSTSRQQMSFTGTIGEIPR